MKPRKNKLKLYHKDEHDEHVFWWIFVDLFCQKGRLNTLNLGPLNFQTFRSFVQEQIDICSMVVEMVPVFRWDRWHSPSPNWQ